MVIQPGAMAVMHQSGQAQNSTSQEAGQIVDQTAPLARLTASGPVPERSSRRTQVWNPSVNKAAPAYMPDTNIAQCGTRFSSPNRTAKGDWMLVF